MIRTFLTAAAVLAAALAAGPAQATGSAFTYQGVLEDSGGASASYDFELYVFDAESAGTPLAGPLAFEDVVLEDGRFLLDADPGPGVFTGPARWLELRVRRGADAGSFTTLLPRQRIFATPYAQHAGDADFAAQVAPASVGAAELASSAVGTTKLASGAVTAAKLATDSVNGSHLQNGSVGTAELASAAVTASRVDASQVQLRVGGTCPEGQFAVGVQQNGGMSCSPVDVAELLANEAYDTGTLVSAIGVSAEFDVVVGARGTLIAVYYDNNEGDLELVRCLDIACTSVETRTLVSSGIVGRWPQIVLRGNGRPVIAHHDDTDGAIKVLDCADVDCSSFTTAEVEDTPGLMLTDMAPMFDSAAAAALTYYASATGDLRIAYCNSSAPMCGSPVLFTAASTGDVGSRAALTYSPDTFRSIWAAYRNDTDNSLDFVRCNSAGACDAPVTVYTIGGSTTVADHVDMAVGADNLPVIAHVRNSSSGTQLISHCDDSTCGTPSTDNVNVSVGGGIAGTSILIGVDGNPNLLMGGQHVHCGNAACIDPHFRGAGTTNRRGRLVRGVDGREVQVSHLSSSLNFVRCPNRWCSAALPPD